MPAPERMTLAEWRYERGLSQVALAEKAGVKQNTVSRIEIGQHMPRPSTLKRLADALQVEPWQLIVDRRLTGMRRRKALPGEQNATDKEPERATRAA